MESVLLTKKENIADSFGFLGLNNPIKQRALRDELRNMRTLFILFFSLLASYAMAQPITSLGTYYVTPSTNGCDGVWAAGPIQIGQCMPPYQYSIEPPGCSDEFIGTSGDTLFISLCSVPCEVMMLDGGGSTCLFCEVWYDVPTKVEEDIIASDFEVFPNPVSTTLNLKHRETEPFAVKLFDSSGRVLINQVLQPSETVLDIGHLKSGIYYLSLESNRGLECR